MEQEKNTTTQDSGVEKLTFDEILKDKEYQAEFDRRLAKSNETAIKNSHEKWEKEFLEKMEQEKSEAEKLAKMDTDQKHQYELKQVQEQLELERAKNNAHDLKDAVTKIAEEKGVGATLLELFDFTRENADSMDKKIKILSTELDKRVELRVNEMLKEKSPKQVSSEGLGDTNKQYLDNKYKNNPYYGK